MDTILFALFLTIAFIFTFVFVPVVGFMIEDENDQAFDDLILNWTPTDETKYKAWFEEQSTTGWTDWNWYED